MRKTLEITLVIMVSVTLIMGVTAPVAAVDGTSDDISAEEPVPTAEENAAAEVSDDVTSVVLVQLNIQSDQQSDVNPEDCQVIVQANEQDADIAVDGDIGAIVVVQQNVQSSSQLAVVTGADETSTEACQEIIQINEQSANVETGGEDLTVVVAQENQQIADQQTVAA